MTSEEYTVWEPSTGEFLGGKEAFLSGMGQKQSAWRQEDGHSWGILLLFLPLSFLFPGSAPSLARFASPVSLTQLAPWFPPFSSCFPPGNKTYHPALQLVRLG